MGTVLSGSPEWEVVVVRTGVGFQCRHRVQEATQHALLELERVSQIFQHPASGTAVLNTRQIFLARPI